MSLSSGSQEVVDLDQYLRAAPRRVLSGRRHCSPQIPQNHAPRCDPRAEPRCDPRSEPRFDPRGDPRCEARGDARGEPCRVRSDSCSSSDSGVGGQRVMSDSGLSDGSHSPKRRPYRSKGRMVSPARVSLQSMQDFRAECERALLNQQYQISRVAELCMRLAERKPERKSSSSSSHSARSGSQCKTYKIIMRKLDELNRVYSPATPRRAPAPPRSPSLVSVVDKTIGTDDRTRSRFGLSEPKARNVRVMRRSDAVAETGVQTDVGDENAKKFNTGTGRCALMRRVVSAWRSYMRSLAGCLLAPSYVDNT